MTQYVSKLLASVYRILVFGYHVPSIEENLVESTIFFFKGMCIVYTFLSDLMKFFSIFVTSRFNDVKVGSAVAVQCFEFK